MVVKTRQQTVFLPHGRFASGFEPSGGQKFGTEGLQTIFFHCKLFEVT
jgi:hypothetical protein